MADAAQDEADDLLPVRLADRGEWTVVRIEEPSMMDVKVIEALHARVAALLGGGRLRLVIDFEEVLYISSSMVGVLVAARQDVAKAHGELVLCGLNGRLLELLKLTRLLPMFTIEPDARAALEGVS